MTSEFYKAKIGDQREEPGCSARSIMIERLSKAN